jgi:exosome complex exonuclease RRP6
VARFPKTLACSASCTIYRLYTRQAIPTRGLAYPVCHTTGPLYQTPLNHLSFRPLPEEMLHYARADTHYLLHIYDQLRNALLEHSHTHPPLPPTPLNGTPPPDAPTPITTPASTEYPWTITRVLARSAVTAGRAYTPEVPDPAGLAKRWDLQLCGEGRRFRSGSPNGVGSSIVKKRPAEQKASVFEAAFWWRDRVARAEDESPVYVLPPLLSSI